MTDERAPARQHIGAQEQPIDWLVAAWVPLLTAGDLRSFKHRTVAELRPDEGGGAP